MKHPIPLFLATLLVAFAVAASAQEHPAGERIAKEHPGVEHPVAPPHAGDGVLARAAADGRFARFLAAVEAAGLAGKLQGEGPFTVFAPTDEAFAKLPAGALDDLMAPANRARLAGLLGNHVVLGRLAAGDIKTMKAANVNGADLEIVIADGRVMVGGAQVVGDELTAGNGVIHAIDTVLVPAPPDEHPERAKPKDHPGH